jgi:hypothetical protein
MLLKRLGVLRVPRHLELEGMHAYNQGNVASVDEGSTHGGQPFWPAPAEAAVPIVGNLRAAQPPPGESGIELPELPESSGALPTAAEGIKSGRSGRGLASLQASSADASV